MAARTHERRRCQRRTCRGTVQVQTLTSGRTIQAELIDISRGGVCLALAQRLSAGELVRIHFPNSKGGQQGHARMIIGHVVGAHSSGEQGRNVTRIAFGWETGIDDRQKKILVDGPPTSIFRRITARLRPLAFVSRRPG